MNIKISIPYWLKHHNRVLYAANLYCEKEGIKLQVLRHDETGVWDGMGEGLILMVNNKTAYLDVSDDSVFDTYPEKYDFYFKRSLLQKTAPNVYPLGLHIVLTYKPLLLLKKMSFRVLTHPRSLLEVIRATDITCKLTNTSHFSRDYRNLNIEKVDHGGNIIYHTRLWDPAIVNDLAEKERRTIQNQFRIEACRIIRSNFKKASVGLYPDTFAKSMAPDLLMKSKDQSSTTYFNTLSQSDICIADAGLKDTPGAKLGEYVYFRKCVIATPINTIIEEFTAGVNYLSTANRSDYKSLPEKINEALTNKRYLQIGDANDKWAKKHLDPYPFFKNILDVMLTN